MDSVATVKLRDGEGIDRLVAYISPPTINTVELEDQLRDHIPSFLVPYLFQLLPRLPLTNYGEVSFLYTDSSDLFLELHVSHSCKKGIALTSQQAAAAAALDMASRR